MGSSWMIYGDADADGGGGGGDGDVDGDGDGDGDALHDGLRHIRCHLLQHRWPCPRSHFLQEIELSRLQCIPSQNKCKLFCFSLYLCMYICICIPSNKAMTILLLPCQQIAPSSLLAMGLQDSTACAVFSAVP
jgi:hypothetical protein